MRSGWIVGFMCADSERFIKLVLLVICKFLTSTRLKRHSSQGEENIMKQLWT